MKRNLLCLLIVVGMFLSTCGNEPPEDYYQGTPEDSTDIHALITANPEFLVSEDLFDPTYLALSLSGIALSDADRYFRADSVITKQHVDSCALELIERTYGLEFWFAKDTTCTVFLWDTVSFTSLMHCDEKWDIYYFWQGDTDIEYDTAIVDTTPYYDSQEAIGICQRHMFFERDENGEWEFKRITYGTWNFPEEAQDVPFILNVVLDPDGNLGPISDTIVWSSYDTLDTRHIMDRFRSIDSLLTYTAGDTLSVTVNLSIQVDQDSCVFFANLDGNRVQFGGGGTGSFTGEVVLEGDGLVNLWIEVVVAQPFYYHYPRKDYKATAWLIPIRITQ